MLVWPRNYAGGGLGAFSGPLEPPGQRFDLGRVEPVMHSRFSSLLERERLRDPHRRE